MDDNEFMVRLSDDNLKRHISEMVTADNLPAVLLAYDKACTDLLKMMKYKSYELLEVTSE